MLHRVIQSLFHRNLSGKELTDEKIHDFQLLTGVQGALIFSIFILKLFSKLAFPFHIETAETIFFILLGVYVFLLWDMLRNYTSSRLLILTNFLFIMGVFVVGVLVVNPFVSPSMSPIRVWLLAGIQICLLAVELSVIYFTLMEFFKKDLSMTMRLWGAACMYLMIGLAFGSAYEIICVFEIQCLGTEIPLRTLALMTRFEFSLMILSGMNTPYTNLTGMVNTLGTIEAVLGQLFIVLIVGRLLVK